MKSEPCREWRESLGAQALDRLGDGDRVALEAHLEGCPECRREAQSLREVGRMLALADPARVETPPPRPPAALGERIAAGVGGERRARRRRTRLRLGLAFGGAAAAVAALAIALSGGSRETGPEQHVEFASLPPGIRISASLIPHAYGTEIHVYAKGMRSGTLCRVFLRGTGGRLVGAGSFRYRWGDDSTAVLSAALDLSRTAELGIRAGGRTFVAPVEPGAA